MTQTTDGSYGLGDFVLQSGIILSDAFMGYKTYGTLNSSRDNVIVFPTWYTGTRDQVAPYVGRGKALDPEKYFIVIPDMFANGSSTSPSNAGVCHQGLNFPLVTPFDTVIAQRRLLVEHFNVTSIELMVGFSMSGQQAYHWAALHSDLVKRACSICGTAKTSPHNWAMLHAYKSTMEASPQWLDLACSAWDPKILAIVASIGATMAMSQDWYRQGQHLSEEINDVAGAIENLKSLFASWVPANLYAQTLTWMAADVSDNATFNGDLAAALAAIKIPFLMMPCDTDLYFRVADNEAELPYLSNATLTVIESSSGHMAGLPGFNAEDDAFVSKQLLSFLRIPALH
jgi:homoserine O-acetyltransferase